MRGELTRMVSDDALSVEQMTKGEQKDFGYGLCQVSARTSDWRGLGVLAGVYRVSVRRRRKLKGTEPRTHQLRGRRALHGGRAAL